MVTAVQHEIEDFIDYVENQTRRNNLRTDDVAERAAEPWADTEAAVLKTFVTSPKLPGRYQNYEDAQNRRKQPVSHSKESGCKIRKLQITRIDSIGRSHGNAAWSVRERGSLATGDGEENRTAPKAERGKTEEQDNLPLMR